MFGTGFIEMVGVKMELNKGLITFEDASSFIDILNSFHDSRFIFEQIDSNTVLINSDDFEEDHHEMEIKTKANLLDSIDIYYEKNGRRLLGEKIRRKEKILELLNSDEVFNVCVSKDNLYLYCAIFKGKQYSDYNKIIIFKEVESMFVRY